MQHINYYFWDQWLNPQKCTFDGANKLIIVNPGEEYIDVKVDIYSDWKEWLQTADNLKWDQALRVVGGDPLPGGIYLGATFFLMNGWKIKPAEADGNLTIDGNIYSEDGLNPVVSTEGNYNVRVDMIRSNIINVVDPVEATVPSAEDNAAAVWNALVASFNTTGTFGNLVIKIEKKADDTQALIFAS